MAYSADGEHGLDFAEVQRVFFSIDFNASAPGGVTCEILVCGRGIGEQAETGFEGIVFDYQFPLLAIVVNLRVFIQVDWLRGRVLARCGIAEQVLPRFFLADVRDGFVDRQYPALSE